MNWLKNFMAGRYGGDQLSMVLLVFSVLLSLIGQLIRIPLLSLLGYIPLGISIYRMFSKIYPKEEWKTINLLCL